MHQNAVFLSHVYTALCLHDTIPEAIQAAYETMRACYAYGDRGVPSRLISRRQVERAVEHIMWVDSCKVSA